MTTYAETQSKAMEAERAIAEWLGRKTLKTAKPEAVKLAIRSIAENNWRWENVWNGLLYGINTGRAGGELVARWRAMDGAQIAHWFAFVLAATGGTTPGHAWDCWREALQ